MTDKGVRRIIVVDPGKLSGYVVADYNLDTCTVESLETVELDAEELWDRLTLDLKPDVEVVYEKFFITTETGKKNNVNYSLEHIGVIKYLCYKSGITDVFSFSPSEAKNFCDNKRLRNVELWHKGGEGHANDALRHLVLHLVKNRKFRHKGLLK